MKLVKGLMCVVCKKPVEVWERPQNPKDPALCDKCQRETSTGRFTG